MVGRPVTTVASDSLSRSVGLKHDGPDGTAGLVADETDYKDVSAQ